MSETSSRIEGTPGVHPSTRLAEQRMRDMLAESIDHGSDRAGGEARSAMDQLRKDVDDRLRAAAKTAGSDRSDPAAMASDPTTLPSATQGRDAASGVMAQLQAVLQQAVLQQQMGDASLQLAAAALLNSLANQSTHAHPFAAATGSPVLTAGDNGSNAGGGFMPGNQPWLQLPDSFSTRSVLPDVATKGKADGSLNPSHGDESEAARQRSEFVRALSAQPPSRVGVALDAARHFIAAFSLSAQQAAGLATIVLQGMGTSHRGNSLGAARLGDTRSSRFPGGHARRQRLIDFSLLRGLDPESSQAALAFIEHELGETNGDRLAAVRSAGSPQQAIEFFLSGPEREGDPWTADELALARSIVLGLEPPPHRTP